MNPKFNAGYNPKQQESSQSDPDPEENIRLQVTDNLPSELADDDERTEKPGEDSPNYLRSDQQQADIKDMIDLASAICFLRQEAK